MGVAGTTCNSGRDGVMVEAEAGYRLWKALSEGVDAPPCDSDNTSRRSTKVRGAVVWCTRREVFAICVSLQRQQLGFDFRDEVGALLAFGDIQEFLDNVVAETVFHHNQQRRRAV
jgi:hypothetical protein